MPVRLIVSPSEIALLAATFGVSASAAITDGGAPYYASVAVTAAFSLLSLSRSGAIKGRASLTALLIFVWLLLSLCVRVLLGDGTSAGSRWADPAGEVQKIVAIYIVLLITLAASAMADEKFQRIMRTVALLHCAVLAFGLQQGDVSQVRVFAGAAARVGRFGTESVATSAWAEIALGTIMAALLCRRWWVLCLAFPIAAYTILAADMRTVGVAAAVMVCLFAVGLASSVKRGQVRLLTYLGGAAAVLGVAFLYSARIATAVSDALLLNDRYRGIGSGFSGRFDNFAAGFAQFADNALFGAGFSNPVVNYTHNGYLLTLAQFGLPLAAFVFWLLLRAIIGAIRRRDMVLFACIMGLSLFYMGQPRNLNFQICPLLGIIACARVLLHRELATATSQSAGLRHLRPKRFRPAQG